jgi:endonuclease YncB( thermonuclease family)
MKTEFRVIAIETPENGPRSLLGIFDSKDWGSKAEEAARNFAKNTLSFQPKLKLEIEVQVTKTETTRIIRL